MARKIFTGAVLAGLALMVIASPVLAKGGDRDVIVVEKPAGILSVPKDGSRGRENLRDQIRAYMRRKIKGIRHSFISPLHRLDAETSGVMVFALSKAGQKLSNQFKNHTIERVYQALVTGRIEKEGGVIKKSLEKGKFGHGRKTRASSSPKSPSR